MQIHRQRKQRDDMENRHHGINGQETRQCATCTTLATSTLRETRLLIRSPSPPSGTPVTSKIFRTQFARAGHHPIRSRVKADTTGIESLASTRIAIFIGRYCIAAVEHEGDLRKRQS